MCIVIDANVAHRMKSEDPAGKIVLSWLLFGKGKLVASSESLRELFKTGFRDTILKLNQAGRVSRVSDEECDALKEKYILEGNLQSDDPHIVALMAISSCDLIFTHDNALHEDLKNRQLVGHTCRIYQTADHRHLLGRCDC